MKMAEKFAIRRGGRKIYVRPENITAEDVILSGDLRLLNLIDRTRGIKRAAIRTSFLYDTDHLVFVERLTPRKGTQCTKRIWVDGDHVRPDDRVLANEHNIRTYRPDAEKKRRPKAEKKVPKMSSKQKKTETFFKKILRLTGKE